MIVVIIQERGAIAIYKKIKNYEFNKENGINHNNRKLGNKVEIINLPVYIS